MQIVSNKIVLILIILISIISNIYATGKRKNFLSYGPSVSAFAQGETALNSLEDPSIIYHNSSLLNYFDYNNIILSRYNLLDGTSYNSASINYRIFNNLSLGISAINLASGDVEIRKEDFEAPKKATTNQWAYIVALATKIKPIETAIGINLKYIYKDLYVKDSGGFAIDVGLSRYFENVDIKYTQAKFGVGLSIQNILGTGIKLDKYNEEFQNIIRLSTLMEIPVVHRFNTKDTITLSVDIKNEDKNNEVYTGLEYKLMDKYVARVGYYSEHITAGFGANIFAFTVNYSIDFNEVELIHRFSLDYRWGKRNKTKTVLVKEGQQPFLNRTLQKQEEGNKIELAKAKEVPELFSSDNKKNKTELAKEAQTALNEEKMSQKEAEEIFKKAKKFYNNGQYLYSTDILQKIIIDYPFYSSPNFYYNKIKKIMKEKSKSKYDSNFSEYAYWSGYKNYYEGKYDECLKEWKKYLQFNSKNKEIKEYYDKVNKIVTDSIEEKNKKDFEFELESMLKKGTMLYTNKQWVKCIKQMEKVQTFIKESKYTNIAFNYYSLAKGYIDKSVKELSKIFKKNEEENKNKEKVEEQEEKIIDEKLADDKYNEGLILYAKGKYFEAERMFELTLRLNPNHKKAKTALKRIKE